MRPDVHNSLAQKDVAFTMGAVMQFCTTSVQSANEVAINGNQYGEYYSNERIVVENGVGITIIMN